MNDARMRAILDAYGAEPRRWPEAERTAAQRWLAAHGAELAGALAAARAVDAALALDERDDGAAEAALAARVLAMRPGSNVVSLRARAAGAVRGNLRAIAALAACALLGVVIGFGSVGGRGEEAYTADIDAAFDAALGFDGPGLDPEIDG